MEETGDLDAGDRIAKTAQAPTHALRTSKAAGTYLQTVQGDSVADERGARLVGDSYGAYIEETGDGDIGLYTPDYVRALGYYCSRDSYLFFPGTLAVRGHITTSVDLEYKTNGAVLVQKTGSSGSANIFIPLSLPGRLLGPDVRFEYVTIYYKCSSSDSYITSTYVNRQNGASDQEVLVTDNTDRTSTSDSVYSLIPDPVELDANNGIINLHIYMSFANTSDIIRIGGVRVRIGHM
jgi:hypothetical protein